MNKIHSFLLTTLLFLSNYYGHTQQKTAEPMEKVKQADTTKSKQNFENYVKWRDKNYAEWLKKPWMELKLSEAFKPDTSPKPGTIPKYEPVESKIPVQKLVPSHLRELSEIPEELQTPRIPVIEQPVKDKLFQNKLTFLYYGARVTLRYDPGIRVPIPEEITGQTIAGYWEDISVASYSGILNSLETEKSELQLNDWGFLQLVKTAAKELYPLTDNGMNLLSWYLLTKSGYKIKIGYRDNKVSLLMPSTNLLYGIRYLNLGGINYYQLGEQVTEISTCDKDFPDATRIFDFNIRNAMNLGEITNERTVNIEYKGRPYGIALKYNMNSIAFYRDYPLSDIKIYFDAAVSKVFKESVHEKLSPLVKDMNQEEAVSFLLDFVQNGFDYKTDEEQFNVKEKFNFPEETLFYPFCDCDDRAVFFAYLVRELVGIRVAAVEYPGHISTAVCFTEDIPGDYISWKGRKYIIADPTYINVPVGFTLPNYGKTKAGIIELGNTLTTRDERMEAWNKTMACGGRQGDNRQNLVTDPEGNSYVAGYFNPRAVFGHITLESATGSNEAFIAKLDKNGQWDWSKKAGGTGNNLVLNIVAGPDSNLYVAGIFSGAISFETANLRAAKRPDIFLGVYDRNGTLLWVNRAGLDSVSKEEDFLYTVSFSRTGKHLFTKLFPANINFTDFGISFDQDGNIYFTSSYAESPGFVNHSLSLSPNADFNIVNRLKEENDRLIDSHYEKGISGLFAFVNLARINHASITGKSVQDALDKYNPEFRNNSPLIYQNIGKIQMMKNNEGIVILKTENTNPVSFDKIKISNDARVKIIPLTNGDIRIDILSGIKLGKVNTWYNLNSVRLLKSNGNLIYDYDDDHTLGTVNLRKELLK